MMSSIIIALLVNLLIETSVSFTVVVPRDQTVARVGSTVTLPCWISPAENAEALEIRWYRHEFNNPVLLHLPGKIQDLQEESYRNRSSLTLRSDQSGGLKNGDVSLRLEKLTVQDEGSFHCYVSGESSYDSGEVVLKVTALGSAPVLFPQLLDDGRVNISCKSSGWYPEPGVTWRSDEGTVLRPGGESRSRGADEMFSVHSWTAVSHSDAQVVSCSISLMTGESREGILNIQAIISSDPPDSSVPWKAPFFTVLICAVLALVGLILYKYRHKLTGKKTVKEVCDDETMESLTKEAVNDRNTEELKNVTVCYDETTEKLTKEVCEDKPTEKLTKEDCEDKPTEKLTKEDCEDKPTEKLTKEDCEDKPTEKLTKEVCEDKATEKLTKEVCEDKPVEKPTQEVCEDKPLEKPTKEVCEDKPLEKPTKEVCEDKPVEKLTQEVCEDKPVEKPTQEVCEDKSMEKLTEEVCEDKPVEKLTEEVCEDKPVEKLTEEVVGDTNIEKLRKHAVQITIDPEHLHRYLKVSKDGKIVRDASRYKPTGKGFPYYICAYGAQIFTSGRHYWEVSLAREDTPPKDYWLIGVAKYGSFRRKEKSAFTPSNGFWFLCSDGPNGFYTNSDPPVTLSLTPRPEQLGVLLDYDLGQLSFYSVKERKLLLTMSTRFSGSVVPLFNPGVGDMSPLVILDCPKPEASAVETPVEISPIETPVESSEPVGNSSDDSV